MNTFFKACMALLFIIPSLMVAVILIIWSMAKGLSENYLEWFQE